MERSGAICLFLLLWASFASGQDDGITWINAMENFEIVENTPNDVSIYQLRATYRGSSSNIIYGINNNLNDNTDNSVKQEDNIWRVYPNGTVSGANIGEIDRENPKNKDGVVINFIARLETNPIIFSKISRTLPIADVNDNAPEFEDKDLETTVMENQVPPPSGTRLIQGITVRDLDTRPSKGVLFLQCTIIKCRKGTDPTDFNCNDYFSIRSQNNVQDQKAFIGDFFILKPLDYEDATVWQVTLQAFDGVFKSASDVVINVLDVQDSPPIWRLLPTLLEHNDGTPENYNLGTLIAEDSDGDVTQRRNISYRLIPTTDPQISPDFYSEKYFRIDEFTGVIYSKVPLDRESFPFDRHPQNNLWTINVKACEIISYDPYTIGNQYGLDCINGTTTVKINDINDNRPVFNQETYVYTIPEDVRNGENLNDPAIDIFDADSDQFNKFTVRFSPLSNEFRLSANDRSPVIQIKNTSLIDYDSGKIRYDLMLFAFDNENSLLSSSATVIIHITDANDNQPVFDQAEYIRQIYEDEPEGTNIVRIQATDIDSDFMGTVGIRYSLEGIYPNLFRINELTGQVTVAPCATPGEHPCIDYERRPNEYIYKVKATDERGGGPNPSYATLIIRILDRNDNPPEVGDYEVNIFELDTETTPPLYVQATDKDVNDILRYSIVSQPVINGISYWQIDPVSGHIMATQKIIYQYAPHDGSFQLQVQVTDSTHTAISQVTIKVLDTNDNAPIFQPEHYEIEIPEDTPGEVFLLDVLAEDADDSTVPNGMVSYYIDSGGLGKFEINAQNGSFYTAKNAKFDFDIQRLYTVIVVATDAGSPEQKSGTGTVTVRILDANNKNPQFVPFSERFYVRDNEAIGHTVGVLTATDPDKDAVLRFYLDNPSAITPEGINVDENVFNFTNLFRIDSETATIYVNQPLDHDKASVVTYESTVLDITPATPQVGRGTVIIHIIKVNKAPPVFAQYEREINIPEEQAIGTFVTSFIATDDDGVIEGFRIVEQSDDYFAISNENGFVTINTRVDYDDQRRTNESYFVVVVTDSGEPTLSATASVNVIFTNINDNYPNFTQNGKYIAEIDENLPDGERVIRVSANDADRPDFNGFADIRYSMDDDRFDIEPETGWIFVRRRNGAELDREATPTLVVQVIGYDTPNGPVSVRKQRVASVIITLRDVNDNPPIFSQLVYRETIYETIPVNSPFLTLFTTDADLGLYGRSTFQKVVGVGNDTNDFFAVNRYTGQVYVQKSLVFYTGTYMFQVEARDEDGQGPFRGYANITIIVLPAANTAPVWVIPPKDNETIYVLEEQYNGMFIYDVSARDRDTGLNGIVDYMFVDGGEETQKTEAFQINPVTGVIHAEIIYDRETTPKYVLLLKAKDRGETRLEATRFLTVVILDVNDNKPYFKENELDFRVNEKAPNRTEVVGKKIEAFDIDEKPIIHYEIISGNEDNAFYLDKITARLFTNKVLDAEVKNIYTLDILAYNPEPDYTVIRNRKKRALDPSILTVKILVGDINDRAPVFLGEPYYGCVSSRSSFDKHIVTVSAVDYDATGTGVVKYRLMNTITNNAGQPLFGIHDTFGVISNKVLMRQYTDNIFDLIVNARDRENIALAESVNTTVTIYVTQPGKEAKLLISQNTAEVRLYQSQIQRIIEQSDILGNERLYRLCINTVRDHVINTAGATTPVWSDVYISGIVADKTTGAVRILSAIELRNIVKDEMVKRPTDFDNLYIKTVEAESSEETSVKESFVLIVMVIIAVLIFLVILFIILAYLCIRAAKQKKKSHLIQRTQAAPAPIPVLMEKEMEPPAVFEAPEPLHYDNKAFIVEPQEPPSPQGQMVVEPEAIHVQYAVVQKRPESFEPLDQEDVVIVSQFRDEPQPQEDEDEFRIVTEPM